MSVETIAIRTRGGVCPSYVFAPAGEGAWPAVIFFMDGLGIRPALNAMAQRLADFGYTVLLPDLYYRAGPYEPLVPKDIFAKGNVREAIAHLFSTTNNTLAGEDTAVFLDHLAARSDVRGNLVGTTGYCMGGGMSLTAASLYPDRIAAAASFHGGNLANDAPSSPHLLAPRMKADIYVAGADEDATYPPEMTARLDQALADAGVKHRCEIYQGARHGWTMTDFPIYNELAAERHWRELIALLSRTLT